MPASHELTLLHAPQRLLDRPAPAPGDVRDRARPEHLAYDRRVLDHRLVVRRDRVEACRDDPEDGVGDGKHRRLVELPFAGSLGFLLLGAVLAPAMHPEKPFGPEAE